MVEVEMKVDTTSPTDYDGQAEAQEEEVKKNYF